MNSPLKAIETCLAGVRFRSRLEARWAIVLECLGLEYRYEHEGFDLDGIRYLPDFYLPERDCWLEIKPFAPLLPNEFEKARLLSEHSAQTVYVMAGDCKAPAFNPSPTPTSDIPDAGFGFKHGSAAPFGQQIMIGSCPLCQAANFAQFGLFNCRCARKPLLFLSSSVTTVAAFDIARSARLEKHCWATDCADAIRAMWANCWISAINACPMEFNVGQHARNLVSQFECTGVSTCQSYWDDVKRGAA